MPGGAIFHLEVSTVSRTQGRSSVAAEELLDTRTGMIHDYRRKGGVLETFLAVPDGCDWVTDRSTLWNAAEAAETRRNSVVARRVAGGPS